MAIPNKAFGAINNPMQPSNLPLNLMQNRPAFFAFTASLLAAPLSLAQLENHRNTIPCTSMMATSSSPPSAPVRKKNPAITF